MAGVTFREVLYALKLKCVLVWDEIKKLEMRKNEIGLSAQCVLKTGKFPGTFFLHFLSCVCLYVCVRMHTHMLARTHRHMHTIEFVWSKENLRRQSSPSPCLRQASCWLLFTAGSLARELGHLVSASCLTMEHLDHICVLLHHLYMLLSYHGALGSYMSVTASALQGL